MSKSGSPPPFPHRTSVGTVQPFNLTVNEASPGGNDVILRRGLAELWDYILPAGAVGVYHMRRTDTLPVVSFEGPFPDEGTNIIVFPPMLGDQSQHWRIIPLGGGLALLQNEANPNLYMAAAEDPDQAPAHVFEINVETTIIEAIGDAPQRAKWSIVLPDPQD